MSKSILITQSNYIPWKGYFDAISLVDEVVLYDEMQYTKRDWRNRNKIKTPRGTQWLSIPVNVKGKYFQKINEVEVSNQKWRRIHWNTLRHNYARSDYFEFYSSVLKPIYDNDEITFLSDINYQFIKGIAKILGIKTTVHWSRHFQLKGDKTERLIHICKELGATDYYTGAAAKDYLDTSLFQSNHLGLHWLDYSGYPEYSQLHKPFTHEVSILDLIFNEGLDAYKFMKHIPPNN